MALWGKQTSAKLALLMLAVALPPAAESLWAANQERAEARAEAERVTKTALDDIVHLQQGRIEGTRSLLTALAQSPTIRAFEDEACDRYLARIQGAAQRYSNLGVAGLDGIVACSAVPTPGTVDIRDRRYFQHALATGGFSIGEYQVGRITGRPSLVMAVPVLADESPEASAVGVVYAALDLEWLAEQLHSAAAGTVLVLSDDSGLILARQPDPERFVGRRMMGEGSFVDEMLVQREGTVVAPGLDGVERFYSFRLIQPEGSDGILAAAGVPVADLYAGAEADFRLALLSLAIAVGLALVLGTLAGRKMIVAPLARIRAGAAEMRRRRYSARLDTRRGSQEHRELAETLNAMAAELEQLDRARARLINAAAHELNTPLTSLKLGIAVLRAQPPASLDPARVVALERNVRRLERTIQDALLAVRVESGGLPVRSEPTRLDEVAREAVRQVAASPEAAPHRFHVEAAPVVVDADPHQAREAAVRLLESAIQSMPGGGEVRLRVAADGAEGVLAVEEDAATPAAAPLAGDGDGLSVGLAVARELARRMGGDVAFGPPGAATGPRVGARLRLPLHGSGDPSDAGAGGASLPLL